MVVVVVVVDVGFAVVVVVLNVDDVVSQFQKLI